jgi:uncharacterized protein
MNNSLKTALITGASSGIGKSLAENFARHGYQVILAARNVNKLEDTAGGLRSRYGASATVIPADFETVDGAAKLHAEVKERGLVLSALANNAGFGSFGEFRDCDLATELAMMQVNMNAVVILTKLFLPDLLSTKGKIINTASTAAFQPGPYMAVYYATKSFVLSFSEALACELEGTGVTVTAFCPGPTASGFQDKANLKSSALVKGKKLPSADTVARAGYRAMQKGRRVYIPGIKNWFMAQSVRFAPRAVVVRVVKAMSKPI